jgi:CRISPR-associated endonuclease/helicase Cas3
VSHCPPYGAIGILLQRSRLVPFLFLPGTAERSRNQPPSAIPLCQRATILGLLDAVARGVMGPTTQPQSDTIPQITGVWAKRNDQTGSWHPLLAHCAEVSAVLAELLAPDSPFSFPLARALGHGALEETARARMAYLAALHDIGKANHGFQDQGRMLPSGGRVHNPGHLTPLLAALDPRVSRELLDVVVPAFTRAAHSEHLETVIGCVIGHHGRPIELSAPHRQAGDYWQAREDRDPVAEVKRLVDAAAAWSGLPPPPEANDPTWQIPEFTHLFAGLLMMADWFASSEALFPLDPAAAVDGETHFRASRDRSRLLLRQAGVLPGAPPPKRSGRDLLDQIFPTLFGSGDAEPTPLQSHVASMPLPEPGTLLVLEAPTGTGKTEAALALFARMRAADRAGGLFFALPTRATARAMFERVKSAVQQMYAPSPAPHVILAVGGDQSDFAIGDAVLPPEPGQDPAVGDAIRWASDSAKRRLAGEVVVGTIDQALLAALPVRHANMRLAQLSRHMLVVDEVHAHDPYMLALLRRLLSAHRAGGGVSLLMSATLALAAREQVRGWNADVTEGEEGAKARPFPVLSYLDPAATAFTDLAIPHGGSDRELHWRLSPEASALEEAVSLAREGARVSILRNTVADVRRTLGLLLVAGAEEVLWRPEGATGPATYHSRYTGPDRLFLDRAVHASLGRGSPAAGLILVATQVVEQSLDIDFDRMFTDMCPVDVLLQRAGRVWRHPERQRPGPCVRPEVVVIEPPQGLPSYIAKWRGPSGIGSVYTHLPALQLTAEVVRERPQIRLPRDSREVVEHVYHPDRLEWLAARGSDWRQAVDRILGEMIADQGFGEVAALDFSKTYPETWEQFQRLKGRRGQRGSSPEERARTRLGDDSIRLDFKEGIQGLYDREAEAVMSIDLPVWVLRKHGLDPGAAPLGAVVTNPDHQSRSFNSLIVTYTEQGWIWN